VVCWKYCLQFVFGRLEKNVRPTYSGIVFLIFGNKFTVWRLDAGLLQAEFECLRVLANSI
jgi:hypothetical protein